MQWFSNSKRLESLKSLMPALPVLVLVLLLAVTLLFWSLYDHGLRTRAHDVYRAQSTEIFFQVLRRMRGNEQVLRGAAGLLNVDNAVSRAAWRRYVATLQLGEHYPGIQGIGFTRWIEPGALEAHTRAIQAEGFPDYRVHPAGDRPAYTSIVYLEPFDWRNQRAFGYDMFSEPVRQAAMARARDSGQTALTARVTLVQETDQDRQNGVLMYVPVYCQGLPTDTVAQRQQAILGFAYSPIRVTDFVYGTLGHMPLDLAFEFYVSNDPRPETLLFSSVAAERQILPEGFVPDFASSIPFTAYGQDWLLAFRTLPSFASVLNRDASWTVLAGGILVSLLLTLIAALLLAAQRRTLAHARMLAESESRFKNAFQHSAIGMALVAPEGAVLKANERLCAMFGYTDDDILKRCVDDLTHPEDLAVDREQMRQLLAGAIQNYEMEKRYVHQRGHCFWGRLAVSLVRDGAGAPRYFVSQVEDIDARKRAEAALIAARDQAEAANRAKSGFLANMSHEIRTPLNAILGFAQVLVRDPTLNDAQRDSLNTIRRSGEHLLTLINEILDLAKIEAGRLTSQTAPFDLQLLLQETEAFFRQRARERQLELRVEAAVPRLVTGDKLHLRQILLNLVGNAIKFTPAGRVTLRAEPLADHRIRFSVLDTGVGIAPNELPRICDPFQQTARGRTTPDGTGLGLALSTQYIRLLGGELRVESTLGRGSCFSFTLPLPPLTFGTPVETPEDLTPVAGLRPDQPTCRILIVDDRADNRAPLRALLASLNPRPPVLEFREAADGQEAVALWEDWQPQVIFMDMRMPVLSGEEATRRIRALAAARPEATRSLIVALTASAFEESRARFLACGCDEFARKPFLAAEIFGILERGAGLKFIRDTASRPADGPVLPAELPDRLATCPVCTREWRASLREAVNLGDFVQIAALLEDIHPVDEQLHAALMRRAYDFDLEAFAELAGGGG